MPEKLKYKDYESYYRIELDDIEKANRCNAISNQEYTVLMDEKGNGYSKFNGIYINRYKKNKELTEKWNKIIELKDVVAKELELERANKTIGNSLDAKVTLYADGEEYNFLMSNKELLQEVFIVSELAIEKNERREADKVGVKVEKADGEKCERCWTYSKTVGEDKEYSTLCHRCSEVMHKIDG